MRPVVYIQADKHSLVRYKKVRAGDLCEIYCKDQRVCEAAENTIVCHLGDCDDQKKKTASAIWLIGKLDENLPFECDFENIGEAEFVFSIDFGRKKDKGKVLKIMLVAAVTFAGSAFAVMTYNEDVSVFDVFSKISSAAGLGDRGVGLLAAGYAVGIAAGIILFFNHFGKRRLTPDPTPMEVEMEKYESDVDDTMIKKNLRKGRDI